MTDGIARTAREVAGPGTGVLAAVRDGERAGADAYVIACFGDPGLATARELAAGPAPKAGPPGANHA
jgi:Asp/Glu/hydantoin racemase